MPRRHTSHYISHAHLCERILTLLAILSAAIVVFTNDAAAQSNYPTKLGVSSEQRTVGVGQRTELRIRLLDQATTGTSRQRLPRMAEWSCRNTFARAVTA